MGDFFANHPLSGVTATSIACANIGVTEWSNLVYNVSAEVYIPTEPPPTIEPRKKNETIPQSKFILALLEFLFLC